MTLIGKVYKLSSDNCEQIYIGSSYCKYLSVRIAHHRQNHRNGWKDYKGLFDNGDPNIEILEEIELENKDEAWKLRELEEKHVQNNDNCMNLRRCYLTEDEKEDQRIKAVKKYHESPLGKISLRKAAINQKLKIAKNNSQVKTIHPSTIKQLEQELNFLTEYQKTVKENHTGQ